MTEQPPTSPVTRSDRIDLAAAMVISALVAVGAAVGVVAALVGNVRGDREVTRSIAADAFTIAARAGRIVPTEVVGRLDASRGAFALSSVGEALKAAAVGLTALLLYRVVADARRGTPFLERNARRLRFCGMAMAGGLAGEVAASLGGLVATDQAGFAPQTSISFAWIGAAAVFFALAQVWSRGVRLAEDADLTI